MLAILLAAAPAGASVARCDGHVVTIRGTAGNDVINGTSGRDVIAGFAGDDSIRGFGGDDVLCGNAGDDRIVGGAGSDILIGVQGNDELVGGNGSDTIYGGRGLDTIEGGDGADFLYGNRGADVILGGRGADEIRGGQHRDVLVGGQNIDRIWGGLGNDACDSLAEEVSGCEHSDTAGVSTTSLTTSTPEVACTQADLVAHFEAQVATGSPESNVPAVRAELIDLINQTRVICGLNELQVLSAATTSAQGFAVDLRQGKDAWQAAGRPSVNGNAFPWFAHGDAHFAIRSAPGFQGAPIGENLAFQSSSQDVAVNHLQFIRSGGHLCNILGVYYDYIGVGATSYNGAYTDFSSSTGLIVVEHFAGDFTPSTPGVTDLIVQNSYGNPSSGTQNCFG